MTSRKSELAAKIAELRSTLHALEDGSVRTKEQLGALPWRETTQEDIDDFRRQIARLESQMNDINE